MQRSVALLLAIFSYVSCSGFMEIRIQSEHRQKATISVKQGSNTVIVLPIGLQNGISRKLGAFPIEFTESYTLSIVGGRIEQLGINESSYTAEFEPIRGTLAPEYLHLPFNGLELIFECDENWSGLKCDVACGKDCNLDRQHVNMNMTTDYTVDMTKLPEIVKRLKETTKVENEIRKAEEKEKKLEKDKEEEKENLKRRNKNEDVLGSRGNSESIDPRKSIFKDIFKTIFSLKDRLASEASINETPTIIDVDRDGNFDQSSESRDEPDFPMSPFSMFRSMIAKRREAEVDHAKEIEKHSAAQKMLGFRHHSSPTVFENLAQRASAISPILNLMTMMPRISRHTKSHEGDSDFDLDQIINVMRD